MSGEMFEPIGDVMKHWADRRDERLRDRAFRLRTLLLPRLRQSGVVKVVLDYDGYGDSTSDETLSFVDASGERVSCITLPEEFSEDEVVQVLYEYAPPGFENNEGGFGQVILDVANGKVRCEHSQRYTETSYSEEEYKL